MSSKKRKKRLILHSTPFKIKDILGMQKNNKLSLFFLFAISFFLLAVGVYLSFTGNKPQTLRSKASLKEHSIGFIGCSNTQVSVQGYNSIAGNLHLFWNDPQYNTYSQTVNRWAITDGQNGSSWPIFDAALQRNGTPDIVWVELCEDAARPAPLDGPISYSLVRNELSILKQKLPNAVIYISPINTFNPPSLCPKINDTSDPQGDGPDGRGHEVAFANQAVQDGLALAGPGAGTVPPLNMVQGDSNSGGCHPNTAQGQQHIGQQMTNFFDNLAGPTGNPSVTTPPNPSTTLSPYPTPQDHGRLHTSGMKLIGEDGQEVRLTGVNNQTLVPPRVGHNICWKLPVPGEIQNVSDWGFNVSSIPFSWGNLEPTAPTKNQDGSWNHHWNMDYVNAFDQTIAQMTQRNRYVMLKFKSVGDTSSCSTGGIPAWIGAKKCDLFTKSNTIAPGAPYSAQEGVKEFWKFFASRYKNNKHVIGADMINEPYPKTGVCSPEELKISLMPFYLNVGQAIRSVNPDIILIYEDVSDIAARQNNFTLSGPLSLPNSVYSFHMYQNNWDAAKTVVDAFLNRAKQWNVPLWMGELHPPGVSAGDPKWPSYTQSLMDYLKQQGISWGLTEYAACCGVVHDGVPNFQLIRILQSGFGFSSAPPTVTPPVGSITPSLGITFQLKLAFQGVVSSPAQSGASVPVKVTVQDASGNQQTATGTFTTDGVSKNSLGNLIFTGQLNFPNLAQNGGYSIFVKGPKHLQKKVCDEAPTEKEGGAYSCSDGKISLSNGKTLDFSGVLLLAGDLPPQDGIITSYDLSFLRNNLCNNDHPDICKDPSVVAVSDINLDGILSTQDYALVISTMSIKPDEQ